MVPPELFLSVTICIFKLFEITRLGFHIYNIRLVCQTNVFVALASRDDPEIKFDIGDAAPQLAHREGVAIDVADVEPLAISARGKKDVVVARGIHGLRERGFEINDGLSVR